MPFNGSKTKQRLNAYSLLLPLAVLLAVAIGWPVFWYVKSRAATAGVSAWMTHEAQLGRVWSCPDQKTGGFPFSVEISCANLLFQGEVLGKTLSGTVRGFRATSPLLRTDNLRARLDPPFAAKTSDGTVDVSLQWGELFLDLEGRPGALDHVTLAGNQVRLQGKIGGIDLVEAAFGEVSGDFVLMQDRSDHAYDFMVSFKQGAIPALGSLFDANLPIDMQVEGTISQVDLRGAETLQDFLENWRSANGHVEITTARLTSGDIIFAAKGGLDLDGHHRVKGKLDASFAGLDKAFRQLGVDPALIAAEQ
ncbi:MAG: DUF2125 domain-containing protein, partial [Methylocella sp.]